MSMDFEELFHRCTPLGELVLRRRTTIAGGVELFEVKLGDDFLMSSLFTAGEIALADLALGELAPGPLDVVVGGLGLGYTASAVLKLPGVKSMLVIEALSDVIEWHCGGLVPLGTELRSDSRCRFVNGDFFGLVDMPGLDSRDLARRFHAILVDIDHSPRHVLNASHSGFYHPEGLRRLSAHLHPGGVFALWSNDPPDEEFCRALAATFPRSKAHIVEFENPLQRRQAANTIYIAHKDPAILSDGMGAESPET